MHFSQAAALERAQALTSIKVVTREQRDEIAEADRRLPLHDGVRADPDPAHPRRASACTTRACCPKYRRLVEQLAQRGLLRVICGTDTLGVGINVPIRTVLLTALTKFDGTRMRQLTAREFHQIAGRAGRAGYDTAGTVVAQAPEHEAENRKAIAKAGDDPKKKRKIVRKKAPEGFVSWGEPSFQRLIAAEPETLTVEHADQPLDDPQRHRPRRRRLRERARPHLRQPRDRGRSSSRSPAGARDLPHPAHRRGRRAGARRRRRDLAPIASSSPSTCSRTSRSTSRCRPSRSPSSSCSTPSRRPTRST